MAQPQLSMEKLVDYLQLPFMPQGILWDMDGTLVDSEAEWGRVTEEIVRSYGGQWTEKDALAITGAGSQTHAYAMARRVHEAGAKEDPWKLFAKVLRGMETHMGSVTLIDGERSLSISSTRIPFRRRLLPQHPASPFVSSLVVWVRD